MFGLISTLLLARVWAGQLLPSLGDYIQQTSSNAQQTTTYAFKFKVATNISADASVSVEFPAQYAAPSLGITTCVGYFYAKAVKTYVPCAVNGRTVTWIMVWWLFKVRLGVWVLSCGIRLAHIYNMNQSVGQFSTFFEFFNHLMERH